MDIAKLDMFWAILNITLLIGIIFGVFYLFFFIVRKVKVIDKRLDNIEKKTSQGNGVNNDKYSP